MRTCKTCGADKSLDDYYVTSKGNPSRECKQCAKGRARANRLKNIEAYRAYDRERANRADRVQARTSYLTSIHGKNVANDVKRRWTQRNQEKRAAHIAVGNAVRDGELVKLPCEICGAAKRIHAHHDDYSKPLEVTWLCPKHHIERHKQLKRFAA